MLWAEAPRPLDDDQAAAALFPFSFARPSSMTSISFSSCLIEDNKSRATFIHLSSVARRQRWAFRSSKRFANAQFDICVDDQFHRFQHFLKPASKNTPPIAQRGPSFSVILMRRKAIQLPPQPFGVCRQPLFRAFAHPFAASRHIFPPFAASIVAFFAPADREVDPDPPAGPK